MDSKNNDMSFKYTYSAVEQEEIKRIRQKYEPREENSMDRLRQLDAKATRKATVTGLTIGILGVMLLGTGMSLTMTDFLKLPGMAGMVIGIVIGILGMIVIALAYPIHKKVLMREREKVAPEILRLSDELMK